jgi:hypothetical protein
MKITDHLQLDDFLGRRASSTPTPIEPNYGQQPGSSRNHSSSSLNQSSHQSFARVQSYSVSLPILLKSSTGLY